MGLEENYFKLTGKRNFYCIMPLDNIPSVLMRGIISHNEASKIDHVSVALEEVQIRRDGVSIPNGMALHKYANLYFDAKNPMMYKRRSEAEKLCILAVSATVLNIEKVVIADRNAASPIARFISPDKMEQHLDFKTIFIKDWNVPDEYLKSEYRLKKCAEVLVPHNIPPHYINGAYVLNNDASTILERQGFDKLIKIKPEMFFR